MKTKGPVTLTIITILIAFLGVKGINNYKLKTLNIAYENNIIKLQDSITAMDAMWSDYFHSPLYSDEELANYDLKPGKFFEEVLQIKKYCGSSNGNCFAPKYKYPNGQPFKPRFEGACAQLKTGPSICMIPQIKTDNIKGWIDVNGLDGPNVYELDLRKFEIKARTKNYNSDDDQIEAVKYINY